MYSVVFNNFIVFEVQYEAKWASLGCSISWPHKDIYCTLSYTGLVFLNIQTNVGELSSLGAKVQLSLRVWGGGAFWAGLGIEIKAQGGGRVQDWTWDWQQSELLLYYYFHNAIVLLFSQCYCIIIFTMLLYYYLHNAIVFNIIFL